MKSCKISIILPVYNTAVYLRKCMDSLIGQTLDEIEIIAVNDGSTDNSFEILREYQALNPRKVYVYNIENSGVSHARNLGAQKASGEYLWFVDSDDYAEKNACELMYANAVQNDSDLVLFGRYDIMDGTLEKAQSRISHYNNVFNINDKPYELVKLSPFPWNKLIKKELFDGVAFPEKIRFEDLPISFILASRAKKISVLDECLYNYRVKVGFLSQFNGATLDIVKATDYLRETLKSDGTLDKYADEIEYITVRHFMYRLEQLTTVWGNEKSELKQELINTLFDSLEKNWQNYRENKYLAYFLPTRIYRLFAFYSSREAMLDFAKKSDDMSEEEMKEYFDDFSQKNEAPQEYKTLPFDELKKKCTANSDIYNDLKRSLDTTDTVLYVSRQQKNLPSSMLALIRYISEEKSELSQVLAVKPKRVNAVKKRLDYYNLSDKVTLTATTDSLYLRTLASAKYAVSDCALEYYYAPSADQSYINLQTDSISANMIRRRSGEHHEYATVQKSIITGESVYLSEESRSSFEKAYKIEPLPTKAYITPSPALDMLGASEIKRDDKTRVLIIPQFKPTNGTYGYSSFRKFMADMTVLDSELDDGFKVYICTEDIKYKADLSGFKHIKKKSGKYDLYDFASSCDAVISDYSTVLHTLENSGVRTARYIADSKKHFTDEEIGLSGEIPEIKNTAELAEYIRGLKRADAVTSDTQNAKALFEKIESRDFSHKDDAQAVCFYYIGGKLTENRVKTFKRIRKEQDYKKFFLMFDEEQNPNYKDETAEILAGVRTIPIRYDSRTSFDDKIIGTICSKGRLPLGASKKFEEQCEAEKRKYFGSVRFDDGIMLSAGAIAVNLLFIGLAKHLSYEFNWFGADKYKNKKPFKAKVDFVCKMLAENAEVKLPDEMKELKAVKGLKQAE